MCGLWDIKVHNSSDRTVRRGGFTFKPNSTRKILIKDSKLISVKSCSRLEVFFNKDKMVYPCPYCDDYIGKTAQGLKTHFGMSHPDKK